ncbi:hypothetical protein JCM10207_007992 [Rhodosporidiobolus poonsookiae]
MPSSDDEKTAPEVPPRTAKRDWSIRFAILAALLLLAFFRSSPSPFSSMTRQPPPPCGPPERLITPEELALHVVKESAWVAIDGQVWDVTQTIRKHPAGPDHIISRLGEDITTVFHQHHHRAGLLELLEREPERIWRVGVLYEPEKQRGRR